jgi:cytochrome c-type biogenesis protein CcmH/NrfG
MKSPGNTRTSATVLGLVPTQGPGLDASNPPTEMLRRMFPKRARLWLTLIGAIPTGLVLFHELGRAHDRWKLYNTVLLGQRWLDAGHLDRASEKVAQAVALYASRPEPWRLASELAWQRGQKAPALDAASHAARLSGNAPDYVLDWAELAVLDSNPEEAERALATLPSSADHTSARALRLQAEIAERQGNTAAARDQWAATVAVDVATKNPALGSDEIRLGAVLLISAAPADRHRAAELLAGRAQARDQWGRSALRLLLSDAVRRKDSASALKWAEALRLHPLCSLKDIRACLLAASQADDAHFAAMLSSVKGAFAPSQLRSAELLGWLTQMGRTREAGQWARSINAADVKSPPLFVAVAEALRQGSFWPDLESWAGPVDWNPGVSLLQQAYRCEALEQLGKVGQAEDLMLQLQRRAESKGPEALLVAQMLYSWGRTDPSVKLLWGISADPRAGVGALGMLVRHYQVQRDAFGLYRAFESWHRLRPQDRMVATGFAFFGSVCGQGSLSEFEQIAADNLKADPGDDHARCALAIALAMDGRAAQALTVLSPISANWRKSRAIAYVYGLSLARAGRKAEGRAILSSIEPNVLTLRQSELSVAALR